MKEEKNMKKQDNRGFSLVELIIVIAIMGILVGVVGTQVVPYMERSREAKDEQILSSVATAFTSAVAMSGKSIDKIEAVSLKTLKTAGTDGKYVDLDKQIAEFLLPESAATKDGAAAQNYLGNNFTSKKAEGDKGTIYISYFPEDGQLYVYLTTDGAQGAGIKKVTPEGSGTASIQVGSNVTLYVESN